MSTRPVMSLLLALALLLPGHALAQGTGILLLAHGGNADWDARVAELARQIDRTQPVEVAFGMATRRTIQAAADRLAARGVTAIVAVPLFVSSSSSIISSTAYLLGLRDEAPAALALYAKMDHGDHGAHAGHSDAQPALGTTPIVSPVPVTRLTSALDAHPIVAAILATRARSISLDPAREAVILVAHGPVSDEDNRRWLADMRTLADGIARVQTFASIDSLTLRDDAPEDVRNAATAELRALVAARLAEGRRVLIVPLLISFGGIERGLATRLDGLAYTMTDAALMPDDRLATWVLEMAAGVQPGAQPVR